MLHATISLYLAGGIRRFVREWRVWLQSVIRVALDCHQDVSLCGPIGLLSTAFQATVQVQSGQAQTGPLGATAGA